MQRLLAASALFALAVLATTATGQQPAPKGEPQPTKKAEPKPANPVDRTEAAIAAALANDPDVKMAQAKIQLAEAELAKARQAATLRVVALQGKLDQLRTELRSAEERFAHMNRLVNAGQGAQQELLGAREKLEAAKAALAAAEAELKLLTGGGSAGARPDSFLDGTARLLLTDRTADATALSSLLNDYMAAARPARPAGPIADRLRAALDKPVKLGAKDEVVTLEKALEVFNKEVGLEVPVRGEPATPRPFIDRTTGQPRVNPKGEVVIIRPEVVSHGETLPVGAWFQMFQDSSGFTLYVREYGLLAATKQTAPPDAPTLTEFWKQRPPVPAAKTGTKDEPPTPKAK